MAQPEAPLIQAIDRETIHSICSGQVIVDLATAVKELVENSIDASANLVEVRFREHGSQWIEVSDTGTGIAPENYQAAGPFINLFYYIIV